VRPATRFRHISWVCLIYKVYDEDVRHCLRGSHTLEPSIRSQTQVYPASGTKICISPKSCNTVTPEAGTTTPAVWSFNARPNSPTGSSAHQCKSLGVPNVRRHSYPCVIHPSSRGVGPVEWYSWTLRFCEHIFHPSGRGDNRCICM
jgi:hypothetical protein